MASEVGPGGSQPPEFGPWEEGPESASAPEFGPWEGEAPSAGTPEFGPWQGDQEDPEVREYLEHERMRKLLSSAPRVAEQTGVSVKELRARAKAQYLQGRGVSAGVSDEDLETFLETGRPPRNDAGEALRPLQGS